MSSSSRWALIVAASLVFACASEPMPRAVGVTPRPPVKVEEWPPMTHSTAGTLSLREVLSSPDGAEVRAHAVLKALTPPCSQCNIHGPRAASITPQERVGRTARPRGEGTPGCPPCPPAAAFFTDDTEATTLRAVGSAEGLQSRHIGQVFVLRGTFHTSAEHGPSLDVSEVQIVR